MSANLLIMEINVNMAHCATIQLNVVIMANVQSINTQMEHMKRNALVIMAIMDPIALFIHAQLSHVKIMEHAVGFLFQMVRFQSIANVQLHILAIDVNIIRMNSEKAIEF